MDKINLNIEPYSFTTSAFLIGLILTNELSELEQISIGNWLQLVGLTLQTYSEQNALIQEAKKSSNEEDLSSIKKAISKIQDELNKYKEKDFH